MRLYNKYVFLFFIFVFFAWRRGSRPFVARAVGPSWPGPFGGGGSELFLLVANLQLCTLDAWYVSPLR